MIAEVEALKLKDCKLLTSKNYEVYLAAAPDIPNVLREVGSLREITFREVGEGTNEAIDLDNFERKGIAI